jgi:hypothetical protein
MAPAPVVITMSGHDLRRLREVAHCALHHVRRAAQPRLAKCIMIDEADRMLVGQAAAQRGVFGHEHIIPVAPDRLQIEQLADMAAARRRQA